jgi:hypothetical protein
MNSWYLCEFNRPLALIRFSPPDALNWRWEPVFKVPQNWGMRGGILGFMQEV